MNKKNPFSSQITLITFSSKKHFLISVNTIRKLNKKSICYITLNKTFDMLKKTFEKKKLDTKEIVFIDAISKIIEEKPEQTSGCYFLNSPGSLEELARVVEKFLKHKFDYILFDSITDLLTYKKIEVVDNFLIKLIRSIRKTNTKAILYVEDSLKANKRKKELVNLAKTLADEVISFK